MARLGLGHVSPQMIVGHHHKIDRLLRRPLKPSASLYARSIAFGTLISAVSKGMLKPTANRQTHWNFGDPQDSPVSLEEFLAEQEAAGFSFFEGKEPWLKGLRELSWQTFFRGLH